MTDKANDKSGSATHEPWKYPGQTAQDRSTAPPKNVVEQEKQKKDANAAKADKGR